MEGHRELAGTLAGVGEVPSRAAGGSGSTGTSRQAGPSAGPAGRATSIGRRRAGEGKSSAAAGAAIGVKQQATRRAREGYWAEGAQRGWRGCRRAAGSSAAVEQAKKAGGQVRARRAGEAVATHPPPASRLPRACLSEKCAGPRCASSASAIVTIVTTTTIATTTTTTTPPAAGNRRASTAPPRFGTHASPPATHPLHHRPSRWLPRGPGWPLALLHLLHLHVFAQTGTRP